MSGMKIGGIPCLTIAALFLFSALKLAMFSGGADVADASGTGVSRMVGYFLPTVLFAALGLWLVQKSKQ